MRIKKYWKGKRTYADKYKRSAAITPYEVADGATANPKTIRVRSSLNSRYTEIVQTVDYGAVTSTSSAPGYYGFQFQFSDLPDYSSYGSVYDQYKIKEIELMVVPLSQLTTGSTSNYAMAYVVNDFDDSSPPTSTSQLLSYQNVTILAPGQGHRRTFVPRVAEALYGGTSFNQYGNKLAPWIDAASPGVLHYGVKITVTQSTSTNVQIWRVFAKFRVCLREQR